MGAFASCVADCSRAGVGYTAIGGIEAFNNVADCSRAGVGYTVRGGVIRCRMLRIALGPGLVTLPWALESLLDVLRIALGPGLVTLGWSNSWVLPMLRIALGPGLVTLRLRLIDCRAVADCSRAGVGYTNARQPPHTRTVADCSRAGVGYTKQCGGQRITTVADCSRAGVGYTLPFVSTVLRRYLRLPRA